MLSIAVAVGQADRVTARPNSFPVGPFRRGFASLSIPCAVGHDPDSLPSVRGSDRPSTHHKRPDGVSLSLQVRAHPVNPSSADSTDVLSDDPTGSKLSHKPGVLAPKARPRAFDAGPLAGDRDVLTGSREASDHNVNWS